MKIVLDSNVLIAAFATHGICHVLFEHCLENHDIFISREMLLEIENKLVRTIGIPRAIVSDIVRYLRERASLVTPLPIEPAARRDAGDLVVLGTAVAAGVGYIVTGDRDLLELGKCRGVAILDPRSFWKVLRDADRR